MAALRAMHDAVSLAVCVPKFTTFWENVGSLRSLNLLSVYLHSVFLSLRRYSRLYHMSS